MPVTFDALFSQALNCYFYCPLHCYQSPLGHFEPLFNDIEAVPELKRTFFLALTEDPNYSEKSLDQIRANYKAKVKRIMALQMIKKALLQTNKAQYVLTADVYADFFVIPDNCRFFIKETKQDDSFLRYSDEFEEKVNLYLIKTVQAYAIQQYEQLLALTKRYEDALPIEDPFAICLKEVVSPPSGTLHASLVRSHTLSVEDSETRALLTMEPSKLLGNEAIRKILAEAKESTKAFYPLTQVYREPNDYHLFLLSSALYSMPSDSYKNLILHVSEFIPKKAAQCNLSSLDLAALPYRDLWLFFTRSLEYAKSPYILDIVAAVDKYSERSSAALKAANKV